MRSRASATGVSSYLVCFLDLADLLPSGGVANREDFPTDGVVPLIVDEDLWRTPSRNHFLVYIYRRINTSRIYAQNGIL